MNNAIKTNPAVDSAIILANASSSWLQQEPAMQRFVEICPEDGQRTILARALKVLADEVVRLRQISPKNLDNVQVEAKVNNKCSL